VKKKIMETLHKAATPMCPLRVVASQH